MNKNIVLVTGASSGIGKSIAETMSENGYFVFAAARSKDKLEAMRSESIEPLVMDITNSEMVANGVEHIIATKGQIDVLVNNAGYGEFGTIEGVSQKDIRRMFDVNLFGLGDLTQHVLPHMRKRRSGKIINISSMVGKISTPTSGWYAATKHALEAMSDALRMELEPLGIDVIVVEPGAINTGFEEISLVTLEKNNQIEDYSIVVKACKKIIQDANKAGPGPDAVTKVVMKAASQANPKARYLVGSDAKILAILKRLLSDRLLDSIFRMNMKRNAS